jgi:hypothetical protein
MPSKEITEQISQQFSFDEIKLPHREASVSYKCFFYLGHISINIGHINSISHKLLINAHYKAQKYLG